MVALVMVANIPPNEADILIIPLVNPSCLLANHTGVTLGIMAGVIAVNQSLLEWSRRRLGVPADRSWYIPNLVSETRREEAPAC